MLLKPTFALLIALLGAPVHANYVQRSTSASHLSSNSNTVLRQQSVTVPVYAATSGTGGNVATSSVYFQLGQPLQAAANHLNPVYVQSVPAPNVAQYSSNAPDASGNYGVVGAAALNDYGEGAYADDNAYDTGASGQDEAAADVYGEEVSDEYGGVPGTDQKDSSPPTISEYSSDAAPKAYENAASGAPVAYHDSYGSGAHVTAYAASGPVAGYSTGNSGQYKSSGCGGSRCGGGGYQSGPIIQHYPASAGYYSKPAPISLSPHIALVPITHAVPVSLAPAPTASHGSFSLGKLSSLGGLEKVIDLEKLEKLLPLDLLKNIKLPSKSSSQLWEGLAGTLDSMHPSLTFSLPQGPRPKELVDQLFAATENILPPITLPAQAPVIVSNPVAHHAPTIAVSKVPLAPIGPPVKLIKQLPISFSKLKLPEFHLPSLDSITSSLGGLGDLLSKFTKMEIVKREHKTTPVPAPVPVPITRHVTPRKIVTAYPLQKGPYSGHVVVEDFPYGRPQLGPFDEGGEATLGCAQLDGVVPAPVPIAPAKY